jgi:polysaccharide export outer membrane protein
VAIKHCHFRRVALAGSKKLKDETMRPRAVFWKTAFYLLSLAAFLGCSTVPKNRPLVKAPNDPNITAAGIGDMPRELWKTTMPSYRIEPPDILTIEAVSIVPRPPYRLRALDVLNIQVLGTLPEAPISGLYTVEPGGVVSLGPPYGSVNVLGLTVEEARDAITQHLSKFLLEPQVSVSLAEISAKQQISGEHLVAPDGTVTLGTYGRVYVAGMTVEEAKRAIEAHLSQFLDNPEVAVTVYAYNSKVYYVITEGAGLGDRVYRFPITGNETVLDAISQVGGLEQISSLHIWIARPTDQPGQAVLLPVDWRAITAAGYAGTNYQILPGDRIFIAENRLVALDTALAKLLAPVERVMGFSLLGVGTVTRFSGPVLRGGGNPRGYF